MTAVAAADKVEAAAKPGTPAIAAGAPVEPSRSQRFRSGAVATLVAQLIGAASQILLVPLFLDAWGSGRYGQWVTLQAAIGYLAALDLGLQCYVINRLTAHHVRGERDAYHRTLRSALALSVSLACLVFLFVALLALGFPLASWLLGTTAVAEAGPLVIILLAATILGALPQGILTGLYRTVGEYPRSVVIGIVQRTFFVVGTVVALKLGAGMVTVASMHLVPIAGTLAYALWDLRRRHAEITLGLAFRDRRFALGFLAPSFGFFLLQAGMLTTLQGTTLVVGALFGASSVALFVTLRTLYHLVCQITSCLTNTLWPDYTELAAVGRKDTLRELHRLSIKVLMTLAVAAVVYLNAFGQVTFAWWTRGALNYHAGVMQAFLVLLLVHVPWTASSMIPIATNRHKKLAWRSLWMSLTALVFAVLLGRRWGLPGVVYGIVAAEVTFCAWAIPRQTCRQIGERFEVYLRHAVVVPLLLLAGGVVATQNLQELEWFHRWQAGSFLAQLSLAAAIAAGSGIVSWWLWLTPAERKRLRQVAVRSRPG